MKLILLLSISGMILYFPIMDFKNKSEYVLFRSIISLLGVLPYPLVVAKLRVLGFVLARVPGFRHKVVQSNLRGVYPHLAGNEISKMCQGVYDNLALTVAETFFASDENLVAEVTVDPGWEILDNVLTQGRGAILATAHLGNFELGGRILAGRYNLLDVIKPQRNKLFDQYIQSMRLQRGIKTVPMDRAIKPVLLHLKNQGVVSLLLDQDAGRNGVFVPFLGLPASTWPGAAHIAIRTEAPVVPVALLRTGKFRYVLKFGKPLDPRQWEDKPADIVAFTVQISGAVEKFIKEYPEQWFWVHRRWKGASEAREL